MALITKLKSLPLANSSIAALPVAPQKLPVVKTRQHTTRMHWCQLPGMSVTMEFASISLPQHSKKKRTFSLQIWLLSVSVTNKSK